MKVRAGESKLSRQAARSGRLAPSLPPSTTHDLTDPSVSTPWLTEALNGYKDDKDALPSSPL